MRSAVVMIPGERPSTTPAYGWVGGAVGNVLEYKTSPVTIDL